MGQLLGMERGWAMRRALKEPLDSFVRSQSLEQEMSSSGKNPWNTVLVLMPEGAQRESLRKALIQEGFKVDFLTNTNEVPSLIAALRPQVFLHDFASSVESQARALQHKLAKQDDFTGVCRIALVEGIVPRYLALAQDTGIRKLMSRSSSAVGLASGVTLALSGKNAEGALSSLQRKIRGGEVAYSQKEIDEAVASAFEAYPSHADVKLEYGNLKIRLDKLDEALRHGEELLEENPHNVRAMNLVSRSLMKSGKFEEALAVLQNADSLSPDNPSRLVLIGDAFFGQGNTEKAREAYSKAQVLTEQGEQDNKDAAIGLGQVCLSEGDAQEALNLFQNTLSEEEAVGFFNNAGVAAVRKGAIEEGLRLYETALHALKTARNKHLILFNMALAHRKLGQDEEAQKSLKRALKMSPNFDKALKILDSFTTESTRKGKLESRR
jgi:tetratricopeptide (TPR) repeat protein